MGLLFLGEKKGMLATIMRPFLEAKSNGFVGFMVKPAPNISKRSYTAFSSLYESSTIVGS